MRKIKEVCRNDNKKLTRKLRILSVVLCLIFALNNSVKAKTLAVSEDFKVSIDSITDGNIDQALMRFVGSEQCSTEVLKVRHELDQEQIALAVDAAENGPLLDENAETLNLESKTIHALKQCAENLNISLAAVLEMYVLANG
ncbi:hypothetical protein MRY82_05610 [bacterium]|nr:hypothetical protein [bacterium]